MLFRQLVRLIRVQQNHLSRNSYYTGELNAYIGLMKDLLTIRADMAIEHWTSLLLSAGAFALTTRQRVLSSIWVAPTMYVVTRIGQMIANTRLITVDSGDIELPEFSRVNTAVKTGQADLICRELHDLCDSFFYHNCAFESALAILFAGMSVALGPLLLSSCSEPSFSMTCVSAFASLWCGNLGQSLGAVCYTRLSSLLP